MFMQLGHFCATTVQSRIVRSLIVQSLRDAIAAGVQFLFLENAMKEGMLLVPVKSSARRIRSRRQM